MALPVPISPKPVTEMIDPLSEETDRIPLLPAATGGAEGGT